MALNRELVGQEWKVALNYSALGSTPSPVFGLNDCRTSFSGVAELIIKSFQ